MHTKVLKNIMTIEFSAIFLEIDTKKTQFVKFKMIGRNFYLSEI